MPRRKQISVVPAGNNWAVVRGGKGIETFDSKEGAVQAGRRIARESGPSQLRIHKRNGRIQEERTYGGRDPFPPEG